MVYAWRLATFVPLVIAACSGAGTTAGGPAAGPIDEDERNASAFDPPLLADAMADVAADVASDARPVEDADACIVGMMSLGTRMLRYCGPGAEPRKYGWKCDSSIGEEFVTTNTGNSLRCNWFADKQEMECLCDFSLLCGRPTLVSRTSAPDEATMLGLWGSMCNGVCQRCNGVCSNTDGGAMPTCHPDASAEW